MRLTFLGKIWNIRVFALVSGAHYATGSGPGAAEAPAWALSRIKKSSTSFILEFILGVGLQEPEWGPKPCQGPQRPHYRKKPYYFTLGLRAPLGPYGALGAPAGALSRIKKSRATNTHCHNVFLVCKAMALRGMVSPVKTYYLGTTTCRKISGTAPHSMQQSCRWSEHIITENLGPGGIISHLNHT